MKNWVFSLTIEIDGEEVVLKRAVNDHKKYIVALGVEDISADEVCLTFRREIVWC